MLRVAALLLSLFVATPMLSRDVYVIGVDARGVDINSCMWLRWSGDVLFRNSATTTQSVRLLNVSNGMPSTTDDTLAIPAGSIVSLRTAMANRWNPQSATEFIALWLWHFEIPPSVELVSYMELREETCAFVGSTAARGQITLPTFENLTSAGKEQVFLGTDLGEVDRRANVGIYNASASPASAEIQLRRICDDALLASEMVQIPPDTAIQKVRFHSGTVPTGACGSERPTRGTYLTVTVDQPSVVFVSAVGNDEVTRLTHNFVGK